MWAMDSQVVTPIGVKVCAYYVWNVKVLLPLLRVIFFIRHHCDVHV